MGHAIFEIRSLIITSRAISCIPKEELLGSLHRYFEKHWEHYIDLSPGKRRSMAGRYPVKEAYTSTTGARFVIEGSGDGKGVQVYLLVES